MLIVIVFHLVEKYNACIHLNITCFFRNNPFFKPKDWLKFVGYQIPIMDLSIENYITKSNQTPWKLLTEQGVSTTGISVKVLRYDELTKRAPSILLKFEPGASYPYHNHPAGEELFVLEGSVILEGTLLVAGDYLYTPPGFKHSVTSETGCIVLFMIPQEVEIA
jgi:quercetin dioxygenase-like cupin family protein